MCDLFIEIEVPMSHLVDILMESGLDLEEIDQDATIQHYMTQVKTLIQKFYRSADVGVTEGNEFHIAAAITHPDLQGPQRLPDLEKRLARTIGHAFNSESWTKWIVYNEETMSCYR